MKSQLSIAALAGSLLATATATQAAVVVQAPVDQSNVSFPVSSTDLLQTSVSGTVNNLTLNVGENNAAGATTAAVLTNGVFGNLATPVVLGKHESHVIDFGTITYNLDTTSNTLGYDITSIETFAGWADANRGTQQYTVEVSTVGSAAFTTLATVTFGPKDGLASSQQKIAIIEDNTGVLATGIDAIRFDFGDGSDSTFAWPTNTTRQEFYGVGYKELDVFGTATVPEPSSLALLGLGGLLIARRRRG